MIRPVLYVDLPGIIYALDRRMRAVGRSFATFICAPEYAETHSSLPAVLQSLFPISPAIRTWIAEDHWRMQGIAQTRARPHTGSWDLLYLASMTHHDANPTDVLVALMEEALNSAMRHGMLRVFARSDEDAETLSLFQRAGFQCYAREQLYVRPAMSDVEPAPARVGTRQHHLRRWHRLDVWGLSRLHDATTPRRVQVAETFGSDEIAHQYIPRMRSWHIPGIEPRDESFVVEHGANLVGWVRVRQGWTGVPHQIWMRVHPEHVSIAADLLRLALHRLGGLQGTAPIICQARDYDGVVIDTLRREGFEHAGTKAILVRHLTMRAFNERSVPAVERARINYGVKGLGAIQSPPLSTTRELLHASHDH